jgi:hypothetical protein
MPAPKGNKHAQKDEKQLGNQIAVRLDDRQLAKLDAYAAKHGLTRSAALRRLVELLDGPE